MKKSVIRKIISVFVLSVLIIVVLSSVFSFIANSYRASEQSREEAINGADIFYEYLKNVNVEELIESTSTEQYKKCRAAMRTICKGNYLDYLYLFTLNTETNTMRYITIASSDDEMDAVVARERGLGIEVKLDEVSEGIRAALEGNTTNEPELIENQYGNVYAWFIPVFDTNGSVIAIIGSEADIREIQDDTFSDTCNIIIPMVLVLIVLLVIELFFVYYKIFRPIKLISNRMNSFVTDRESRLKPLGIKSNDEIHEIADSFEKMAADITKYIADIETMTTERVQAGVQLEVARRIQCGIVPETTKLDTDAFNAYAIAKPAKSVGGDFYDCFTIGSKVCVTIGDVSGKGVAAALFMSMVKTMIRERLHAGQSPAETLNIANDELCGSNPEGMFATVFVAVLDTNTGTLTYANAGHTRPVIIGEKPIFREVDAGIVLGLFEEAGIEDCEMTLKKGQGIILYTDGATEAVSAEKTFFGEARLIEAVSGAADAHEAVTRVENAVKDFSEGCEQFDDLTVLSLFYIGCERISLKLKPEFASFKEAKDAIDAAVGDSKMKMKIKLACEEIFVNIISHSGAKSIDFQCEREEDLLTVSFADDGVEFDPTAIDQEDKDFEDLDMGGMGISLVKQIARELKYDRVDGKNILTMKFAV